MSFARVLKDLFRDDAIQRWWQRREDGALLAGWEKAGSPLPPPPAFKRRLIRDVAKRFGVGVLVETGTHWGNTVAASLGTFATIYSVELSDGLYEHARRRFARHRKVKLRHGDSAGELSRILDELREPALFWLDAHYSGDGTARADVDTPITQELEAISRHFIKTHLILIDDARCFSGTSYYPTIDACRTLAAKLWPSHRFAVADDIIQITPGKTT